MLRQQIPVFTKCSLQEKKKKKRFADLLAQSQDLFKQNLNWMNLLPVGLKAFDRPSDLIEVKG